MCLFIKITKDITMKNNLVLSFSIATIVSVCLLSPQPANATVRIRAFGIDICFTGKKNPNGCKDAVKKVTLEDDAMQDMEALQGKNVTIEKVAVKVRPRALNQFAR